MPDSTLTTGPHRSAELLGAPARPVEDRPAAAAAARVSRASLALGAFGLAACFLVISRLAVSWHVTSGDTSHRISVFGQLVAYPSANFEAIVILVLAVLGVIVTAVAVTAAVQEAAAARRFMKRLADQQLRPLKGALVLEDDRPHAFCAGLLWPRVYVSTGAVALLDPGALDAVLEHERHHARRHDPLRVAAGRVLVRALFFMPWLDALVRREQALAELGADESAIAACSDNRAALARAMLTLSEASDAVTIDPARVDQLVGEPVSWAFPRALCVAATVAVGLVVAVALFVGALARGSASLAPPFLSRQPCILVLALIPVAVASLAAACAGRLRSGAGTGR